MTNGIEALSKMSGMKKSDIKQIAEKAMENNKKLNGCIFHDFSVPIGEGPRIKYECQNCHGVVDGIRKKYYELGLLHSSYRTEALK